MKIDPKKEENIENILFYFKKMKTDKNNVWKNKKSKNKNEK
jgi:hypothetical protein